MEGSGTVPLDSEMLDDAHRVRPRLRPWLSLELEPHLVHPKPDHISVHPQTFTRPSIYSCAEQNISASGLQLFEEGQDADSSKAPLSDCDLLCSTRLLSKHKSRRLYQIFTKYMKLKDNTLALVCRGNMRGHNSEIDAITMTRLSHPSSLFFASIPGSPLLIVSHEPERVMRPAANAMHEDPVFTTSKPTVMP